MLLDHVARTSAAVSKTRARLKKVELLAACLRLARPEEIGIAVAYLSGVLPQGTIGVGWASLRHLPEPVSDAPTLALLEVDAALGRIGASAGRGSQALRRKEVGDLFGRTTETERRFLVVLITGQLRQGALEGVMVEAVARAASVPAPSVRRALMLAGDLAAVAKAAMADGEAGLQRFRLALFRPLQPMLAQSSDDLETALGRVGEAAVEWKVDGARIQVHRRGRRVAVYTRNLAEVTDRVPELVEAVRSLSLDQVVLDGEAIALQPDGRPHPFQVTMSRFGSRLAIERLRADVPLSLFLFDCLHLDGDVLVDRPGAERFDILSARAPQSLLIPRIVAADNDVAQRFMDDALERGHEGVMVKALDAFYEAGRRGAGWIKVKRAHTLDLVVLAAEWGHGRRHGWLSNLHLGARDKDAGFVMLGKTFKGMTDEMLAWQTEYLSNLQTHAEGITVYVRPELVVEVAFDGVQSSTRYPGRVALRFARIKGYRLDKTPAEVDTLETVQAFHDS